MTAAAVLEIPTPRWALPLLPPAPYKGAYGGRSSGKSRFFGGLLVDEMVADPYVDAVCIREIQRSLKYSAKRLIEREIRAMGVQHLFDIRETEIRRKRTDGTYSVCIFQGMQDHTADSVKSLESFGRYWVEEAQSLSRRSFDILLPTIRDDAAELWASWNPDQPDDPIDEAFRGETPLPGSVAVQVNYLDNPFLPDRSRVEAETWRERNPDGYAHVWLGGYNTRSESQVLAGKWTVREFTPGDGWEGPYHGLDWGFAQDPTCCVRCWVHDDVLYVEYDAGRAGLELDETADWLCERIPDLHKHVIRADNARPESISHVRRMGLPKLEPVKKGKGSVQDGIEHLRSYRQMVIHPRCVETEREARLYSYKVDKQTGDVLPVLIDKDNHRIDAIRYALEPLMRPRNNAPRVRRL